MSPVVRSRASQLRQHLLGIPCCCPDAYSEPAHHEASGTQKRCRSAPGLAARSQTSYCDLVVLVLGAFAREAAPRLRVREYGNVAVVSSCYDMNLESGRTHTVTSMAIQYLTVYTKEQGAWRIVAQQTTRLPEPK